MPSISTGGRRPLLVVLGVCGLVVVLVVGAFVGGFWLGSSHAGSTASSGTAGPPNATAMATPTVDPNCIGTGTVDSVTIRWFVGLGSGTQPDQIDAQKHFVTCYNASHNLVLKLEIVPNTNAYDVLKTEIASGNAPDIIGPVGVKGRNGFEGLFLDLTGQIGKQNYYLNQFDSPLVDFLKQGADGQVGLPYLIYPAFIFYNKDLFDKAGLPNLPTRVGETYQGKTWDWDNLSTIAAQLTLDSANKKATDAAFDPDHIVQFGMDFQWADGRRMASCFGGGSFVATDGKTAQIPKVWADAWNWYYDAMWKKHFAPTFKYTSSTALNSGATVSSGKIAMDAAWGWTISSYGSAGKARFSKWGMGVMPSWKGQTSSPLDIDTFVISKSSRNPDAAFQAMVAIMADKTLMQVYGGMPARTVDQAAWFDAQDEAQAAVFPGNKVDWSVLQEMAKYPATPSHEADMPPNFLQSTADYGAFYTSLQTFPNFNMKAELTKLQQALQKDWDCSCIMYY